jgi:hypothetical protein
VVLFAHRIVTKTYLFLFSYRREDRVYAFLEDASFWLFVLTPLAGVASAWLLVRLRNRLLRRRPRTNCLECGYNLTGNVSGMCPECGAEVPACREHA